MAQKRRITIIVAVLAFVNGVIFLRTNLWFGLTWLVLGVLLSARYFSPSVREFVDRNRLLFMILTFIIFGIIGVRFYTMGNLEFALVLVFLMIFVGVLILMDIWATRTFPDLR